MLHWVRGALLASLAFPSVSVLAADNDDSLGNTIVVTGGSEPADADSFETRHSMSAQEIGELGAASADQIIRRLPSVYVPVNSRGEAIAFARNAGERQVAIFYEGAALNIPWDNRLDLSLVPAALIGSVRTAAGPLAPHYGVNALGALSLSARQTTSASAAFGSADLAEGDLAVATGALLVGGSYGSRAGETLSDDAKVPFSQSRSDLRTNTDRDLGSVFARIGTTAGVHDLSLTAFHVWGDKGIAPEGNRQTGARFWRYPDIRHSLISGSASSSLGADTTLSSALWYQRFGQTIDNYTDSAYDRISARQVDQDETWGIRELLEHNAGAATLTGSFSLLDSTHRQRDIAYSNGNTSGPLPPRLLYHQRNWSVGAEMQYEFTSALHADIGIGYDTVDYLRTGDKPPVQDASEWTGRAGIAYSLGNHWRLRGAAGRKMRAPTLRERFGEAINRFLPNPDLKPELITTWELAAEWRGPTANFFAIPFTQNLDNTIDQRNVGRLRQRINLPGSTVHGVELGGAWSPFEELTVSGDATWTRVRRKNAPAGQVNRIAEKPSLLARARATYAHRSGLSTRLEVEHVGRAYSADPDGTLVPLERSTSLNMRLAYAVDFAGKRWELFGHVDNLTDTFIEPQLGLPAPGRSVRIGLRFDAS